MNNQIIDEQTIAEDAWRYNAHTFAEEISGGDWKPYAWLVQLMLIVQAAILEGNARIIINAPPRHGKSISISKWIAAFFLEWFPEKHVIIGSYGDTEATKWSRQVRDLFSNKDSKTWTRVRHDKSLASDWETTKGGGMRATGVGGAILGHGGDLNILDDVHKNWEEAQSAANRRRVIDWFESTFMTRAEPGASVVVVQHRWHPKDLSGHLIDKHGDRWIVLSFPAIAEDDNDLLGRKKGEPLCQERYDLDALAEKKVEVGSHKFASLYQQAPTFFEGGIIKRHWIRFYQELPEGAELRAQSWDFPFEGNDKTSTRVAGQVWSKHEANHYLRDMVSDHMDFVEQLNAVLSLTEKWPGATAKIIEKKANGAAILSSLDGKVEGLIEYNPVKSKELRMHSVSPLFEAGNVWVPDPDKHPWVEDWIEEICAHPHGSFNDQGDACSQYLDWDRSEQGDEWHYSW